MQFILRRSFNRLIARGSLKINFASGDQSTFGDGSEDTIVIRFTDRWAQFALAYDPALKLGEMYMQGRLIIEQGSVYDLISLIKRNGIRKGATFLSVIFHVYRHLAQFLTRRITPDASKRNVAHHYDLDEKLFRFFLDDDMQYSSAYFEDPDQTLDEAQLAKKRHIASKMLLEPQQQVLDIGSGWGGMALYLAQLAQSQVTGITLSEEQARVSQQRVDEKNLTDQIQIKIKDYRLLEGQFDRIVSIGMFEHVGIRHYREFFESTAKLMKKEGVFVLHSIGRTRASPHPQPFINKYIFPGFYLPALSEVLPEAERAGWLIKDIEILPLHYAATLREWRRRFLAHRAEILDLYDEEFIRMWEFYLAAAETSFRHDRMFNFQLQLARHQDAVPITRDYMAEKEMHLREAETRYYAEQAKVPK